MPALKSSMLDGSAVPEGAADGNAAETAVQRFSAELVVRGQSEARRKFPELSATHVISIKLPGHSYLGPRGLRSDRQLFVSFDDIEDLNAPNAPDAEMVERILDFARNVPKDGRLLVHGLLGVRRTPAVALGLLADRLSPVEAAQALAPL